MCSHTHKHTYHCLFLNLQVSSSTAGALGGAPRGHSVLACGGGLQGALGVALLELGAALELVGLLVGEVFGQLLSGLLCEERLSLLLELYGAGEDGDPDSGFELMKVEEGVACGESTHIEEVPNDREDLLRTDSAASAEFGLEALLVFKVPSVRLEEVDRGGHSGGGGGGGSRSSLYASSVTHHRISWTKHSCNIYSTSKGASLYFQKKLFEMQCLRVWKDDEQAPWLQ